MNIDAHLVSCLVWLVAYVFGGLFVLVVTFMKPKDSIPLRYLKVALQQELYGQHVESDSGHVIHSEKIHRFHLDRVIGREDIKTFHIEIARVRSDGSIEDEGFPDPPAVRWQ